MSKKQKYLKEKKIAKVIEEKDPRDLKAELNFLRKILKKLS